MELHGGYRHRASEKTGRPVEEWLDFSANINPFGMPKSIKNAMIQAMEELIHYPDPDCLALTKALAQFEQVKEERIFCGNGGADVLYRYLMTQNPKKVLIPVPTFVEYEEVLKNQYPDEVLITDYGQESSDEQQETMDSKSYKREIVHYSMAQWEEKDGFYPEWGKHHLELTEEVLQVIDSSYDLMILCSPNNPTGKVIEQTLLKDIVECTKKHHVALLLDLSFSDFLEEKNEAIEEYLKGQSHVMLLHSFTKMYGMPGIRIGYGVLGLGMNAESLKTKGPSWTVNHLAQIAGLTALKETEFVKKTVDYVAKERQSMEKKLEDMGYLVVKGKANYILFQKRGDTTLHKRMLQRGILIRSCQNYAGLGEDYYRIAIKNSEQNKILIEQLKEERL